MIQSRFTHVRCERERLSWHCSLPLLSWPGICTVNSSAYMTPVIRQRSFCVDLKSFFWNTNTIAVAWTFKAVRHTCIPSLQAFRYSGKLTVFLLLFSSLIRWDRGDRMLVFHEQRVWEFHATLILLYVFLLTDIDECAQDQHLCSQGRCENTEGSFLCICPAGFMASEEGTNCIGNSSALSDAKILSCGFLAPPIPSVQSLFRQPEFIIKPVSTQ